MRLGLVADTHIPEAGPVLPEELYAVLGGCDRILHCGDLHSIDVLDWLGEIAPVICARGNGDTLGPAGGRPGVPDDPRIEDLFVFDIDGFRIGLIHDLEDAESLSEEMAGTFVNRFFGEPVDIALSGHTHIPMTWGLAGGTTLINPGSPTMPYGYPRILGTVGLLDVEPGRFELNVINLATGATELHLVGPGPAPHTRGPRPATSRRRSGPP